MQGTRKTFLDCIYVNSGDYRGENKSRNLGLLFFWSIQDAWANGFSALITIGLFTAKSFRWWDWGWVGASTITILLTAIVAPYMKGWTAYSTLATTMLPGG